MSDLRLDLPTDAGPAPDLCQTCQHPMVSHDLISSRWCAATRLGTGDRDCICSERVLPARILAHY